MAYYAGPDTLDVVCPVCKAGAGEPCVTKNRHRELIGPELPTIHGRRWGAAWDQRQALAAVARDGHQPDLWAVGPAAGELEELGQLAMF